MGFDPILIPLGNSTLGSVFSTEACSATDVNVSSSFRGNWSTGNTSIATVDYSGSHAGMGAGSTSSLTNGKLAQQGARTCPLFPESPAGTVNVQACQTPASETTQAVRQAFLAPFAPTATDYLQTLVPTPPQIPPIDNGAAIDEAENAIGTDSCWFPGSSFPQFTSVSGGYWIVGSVSPQFPESQVVTPGAGQWGPDQVGWGPSAVRYYQQNRPMQNLPVSCSFVLSQNVAVTCPNQPPVTFVANSPLSSTIDATGLTNCREGVCTSHIPYQ